MSEGKPTIDFSNLGELGSGYAIDINSLPGEAARPADLQLAQAVVLACGRFIKATCPAANSDVCGPRLIIRTYDTHGTSGTTTKYSIGCKAIVCLSDLPA